MARKKFKNRDGDATVTYSTSEKINQQVVDWIIEWFKEHDCYNGEVICSSDDCQIYAANLLGQIADDILKIDVQFKDD